MDIQGYLTALNPLNILDILEKQVLVNLINGYSYTIGSGITLIYPAQKEISEETFGRIDAFEKEAIRTFNPLCAYWRNKKECNQEINCKSADIQETMRYFDGRKEEPRIYRCKPLGLWDMTYPLYINGHIVGVLFAGQVIIREEEIDWITAFGEYQKWLDRQTFPEKDHHLKSIEKRIRSSRISEIGKDNLLKILFDKNTNKYTINEFKEKVEHFKRFGSNLQELLNELYESRKSAIEQKILNQYSEGLSAIDFADSSRWWKECENLLTYLNRFTSIEKVFVFVGSTSRFYCEIPQIMYKTNREYLKARDIIPVFQNGKLMKVTPDICLSIFEKLSISDSHLWGCFYKAGIGNQSFNTLIIYSGMIAENQITFIENLSRMIYTSINTASTVFHEREADKEYQHNVAMVGHSFRTPLQSLLLLFEDLEKRKDIYSKPEIIQHHIRLGKFHIFNASEDLIRLMNTSMPKEEIIDIGSMLNEVISSMEQIAAGHPCVLSKTGNWLENILVRGPKYEVQRAFTCLIDNAIKYSFFGINKSVGSLYEVRIEMNLVDNRINIIISNYGIGVPKEKILNISEYGTRGGIEDKKITRTGMGLGLPFAIEVFENIGGWILVESNPSPYASEEDIKKYIRYNTKVEVSLPRIKRN